MYGLSRGGGGGFTGCLAKDSCRVGPCPQGNLPPLACGLEPLIFQIAGYVVQTLFLTFTLLEWC